MKYEEFPTNGNVIVLNESRTLLGCVKCGAIFLNETNFPSGRFGVNV